jgi:hypothetical protein
MAYFGFKTTTFRAAEIFHKNFLLTLNKTSQAHPLQGTEYSNAILSSHFIVKL